MSFSDNPGLSGRFFVTALPTIYHVKEGQFRRYTGSRDINSFMSFVEDKKWAEIEPVDAWKKPDGILMSILSWFFRLSHFLKVSHSRPNHLRIFIKQFYNLRNSTTNFCWTMACQHGPHMPSSPSSRFSSELSADSSSSASLTSSGPTSR